MNLKRAVNRVKVNKGTYRLCQRIKKRLEEALKEAKNAEKSSILFYIILPCSTLYDTFVRSPSVVANVAILPL